MYRHSTAVTTALNYIPSKNSLPSPENTSESDSEIHEALDLKRRQLEEEISLFRLAKEREFRDFEKDLRLKRKRTRSTNIDGPETPPIKGSSSCTSALDLLAISQNGSANGWSGHRPKKGGETEGGKSTKLAPLSKPTLSLDKLNISGETTPPLHSLATPPTPTILYQSLSRSPPKSTPSKASPKPDESPLTLTPAKDRADYLTGVFMPAYLPLLESRDSTPVVTSPRPMSAQDDQRMFFNLDTNLPKPSGQQAAQSLPQQPVSPPVVATKRANSSPQLPTKTPPSALRTVNNAALRKRKRVTFQLADSAIVEPSSSYEEMPSPEPRSESDSMISVDNVVNNGLNQPYTLNKASDKAKLSPDNSKAKIGRKFQSPLPSPSPSPVMLGRPGLLASPDESGFSGGLLEAEDGGSGVGFFELDEELASPILGEKKHFPEEVEVDLDEKIGLGLRTEQRGDALMNGGFAAGSLPIDIKPMGSWVGSFGH